MSRFNPKTARKTRRAATGSPAPQHTAAAKKRWRRWAVVAVAAAIFGYLVVSGRIWSAGDWQLATAGIRGWFAAAPPPDDDPDEKESPPINADGPPGPAPAPDMAWIPGGWFWRGFENAPDAVPLRKIYVDGFWMQKTEITNKQWQEFADATGYVTAAERKPELRDFPNLSPEALVLQDPLFAPNQPRLDPEEKMRWPLTGAFHALAVAPLQGFPGALSWGGLFHTWPALEPFSLVFTPPAQPLPNLDNHLAWWRDEPGACWKHPLGRQSSIAGLDLHPVVHICWNDAIAYCQWKTEKTGRKYRLPTEAEWEFAARGGLDRKLFTWGDELTPNEKWQCNVWQGKFPFHNDKTDGFEGTAPVGSFQANGYGLHDMAGNVWEWCSDWYVFDYYKACPAKNPQGPKNSLDPREPGMPKRVQRGGSFLCCENYCVRFIAGARGKGEPTSAANHIGFRVAVAP